ncbi:MAG: AraC family transcriptional regulator, partial [Phaeodactylibacter sp.]|nr:AraC family transcriptional regulator [Phaeodactylibacter sp.]
ISFLSNNISFWIAFPEYPLNLFVDHFVLMEGTPSSREEKLFPNNKAEVFFNLGDPLTGQSHGSHQQVFHLKESVVSGARHSYFSFEPGTYLSMAGLRFTLFGFYHVFGIPAQHFTNRNFEAMDVWGREMERVRECLLEAKDLVGRIRVLQDWIAAKVPGASVRDMQKWKQVEDRFCCQEESVAVFLQKMLGYSHKHSIRLIKEKSGLTPKTIQKVNRFSRALRMLNHPTFVNWAQLALDAGYADQSHFIREFSHFSGYTPATYLHDKPRIYKLHEQLEASSKTRE